MADGPYLDQPPPPPISPLHSRAVDELNGARLLSTHAATLLESASLPWPTRLWTFFFPDLSRSCGPGVPSPPGILRVLKRDADGDLCRRFQLLGMWFFVLIPVVLVNLLPPAAAATVRSQPRSATGEALSISPAENWDGIDGQWSSFYVQVGTPAQAMRVMVSTASEQTLVVLGPQGCSIADDETACADARGQLFKPSASTTWDPLGTYGFDIETNLDGYDANGNYGLDMVSLGLSTAGSPGPIVQNVTVGAFAVYSYYLGLFGLNPKSTNLTDLTDPIPSWMTRLHDESKIPSLSWGYTAGMPYGKWPSTDDPRQDVPYSRIFRG
jgi:hypothetical protein